MATTRVDLLGGMTPIDVWRRGVVIGVIAFLTLVDLFGAQAILPRLTALYGVEPGTMGLAVNASTIGMVLAGLVVAYYSDRIDRRRGVWLSLAMLSAPTFLLAFTDDVLVFGLLRIWQGACMAAAFTLTMTYLSERCDKTAAAGAMAAYVTGNVVANLVGRLIASGLADVVGVQASFLGFAVLNAAGALLAWYVLHDQLPQGPAGRSPFASWRDHWAEPRLRASFAIGFLLLFVFVGVYTYVNFWLVGPQLGVAPAALGLVYLVFLPAVVTTPFAGKVVGAFGARPTLVAATLAALAGVAASALPSLPAVLAGLTVIGIATFLAQAAVTAFVGRTAKRDHAAANGLYLTSYYLGGLTGAFMLGLVYDAFGWPATAAVLGSALVMLVLLTGALREAPSDQRSVELGP